MDDDWGGYLIYHPSRQLSILDGIRVYHDSLKGNQDPYIWNENFLHSFCHITQMTPEPGHINFWVSGDGFPDFSSLSCDLVFIVQDKLYWQKPNHIDLNDPIVDSDEAFNDHYQWAMYQHEFKRRRRYTLKADPQKSFQPQDSDGNLINIISFLLREYTLEDLRSGLRAGYASRPMRLKKRFASSLYGWLSAIANTKLPGRVFENLRRNHSSPASLAPNT